MCRVDYLKLDGGKGSSTHTPHKAHGPVHTARKGRRMDTGSIAVHKEGADSSGCRVAGLGSGEGVQYITHGPAAVRAHAHIERERKGRRMDTGSNAVHKESADPSG